jgi:hypothetical protein
MEFEKYDPEEHGELAPAFFSDIAEQPQSFEEFREATKEALEDIDDIFGRSADFDVVLADVDMNQLSEDAPLGMYFRGYSLGMGVQGHAERDIVFLAAPSESEYWRPGLKNMAVHEESHQEFYQYIRDMEHVIWESMVFEGHALFREKTVREEKEYQWRGDPRSYEGNATEVIDVLDKNREWEGPKYERDNVSSIFSVASEWEGIGYVIAQKVYADMLDRNNMDVDEPLEKDREWLRSEVEKSIDKLYGD